MPGEKILLKNCNVISPGTRVRRAVDVEIEDGIISSISDRGASKGLVLDCEKKYVLPGFVNAHSHCYQNMMRGLGSDLGLVDWLECAKYPVCEVMNADDIYISTMIAHLEMIKSGITSVIDNFDFGNDLDGVRALAKAYEDSGIRGVVARGMRVRTELAREWRIPEWLIPHDEKVELSISEQVIREFNEALDGRLRVYLSPTALYYSTKELLLGCKELSEKYDVCIHSHVAEGEGSQKSCVRVFGKREIEILDELGILSPSFQAVHATDLSERELKVIGDRGCGVVHNPVSNMYLATGVCTISALFRLGVNVALGTDGAGSNDSYNFFETMKIAALLQKITSKDPAAVSADRIFAMATQDGAAMISNDKIGKVEEGYRADLSVIDLNTVSSAPTYKPVNNIVYAGAPSNVVHVIIDGAPVLLDGKFTKVDEAGLMNTFIKSTEKIARKLGYD